MQSSMMVKCGGDQMKTSCSCWDQSLLTSRSPMHRERERKEKGRGKREQVWPKISISGNLCRVPINYLGSGAPMTE